MFLKRIKKHNPQEVYCGVFMTVRHAFTFPRNIRPRRTTLLNVKILADSQIKENIN